MTALAKRVYKQALGLPIDDQLHLIDILIQNTHLPAQKEIDQAWAKEVVVRCELLEKGKKN